MNFKLHKLMNEYAAQKITKPFRLKTTNEQLKNNFWSEKRYNFVLKKFLSTLTISKISSSSIKLGF